MVLTTLHSRAKFDRSTYKVSEGLHGVGSSVVNALSESLVITIRQDGKISRDEYRRGKPVTELVDGLLPVIGRTKETGTEISFRPDPEIFGDISFKESSIRHRLHETAYLNPGLTIHFRDDRTEEPIVRTYHEPDGISAYIADINKEKEKVTDIIRFRGKDGGIEVEAALQFCNNYEETILGFCNNIYNVEGGTHITGFKNRFTTMINSYARELGILKEKDDNFTGADTRSGLTAIVAVKHPDPMFEGQTKTKLGSADAARAVNNVVNEQLTLFLDKNLETLKKIIGCAEKSAKIRKAEEKTRSNLLSKPAFSFDGNGKLANCEGRDASKNEIFIVEGDSAGGSAKTARDRRFQAILPIRGKILNVEKATMDKVLANLEIKTMINAFGCGFSEGYGNDFDISRLKYDKIIIMTDADVDGSHISVLLLTFFYRFMPDLIREGHVYIATSPLYKAIPAKGEQEYIYDDAALEKYRQGHKNFTLQRFKGLGEMDSTQLWETTMNPATRLLRQVEIEDVQSADHITELLMGSQVEPRRQYIQDNAVYATLDV
jgi:DNA gyrase subunit B